MYLYCSSSKDEDFYSSLALAAEDDNVSDVSEANVGEMAKSIAVSFMVVTENKRTLFL